MAASKAQVLSLECQNMLEPLNNSLDALNKQVEEKEAAILSGVEEMEAWLGHVHKLLNTEPQRLFQDNGGSEV